MNKIKIRKAKQFFLFFIFLLMIIPIVNAKIYNGVNFSNNVFNENFEYTSNFTVNGWDFNQPSPFATHPRNPYNFSTFFNDSSNAFGWFNNTEDYSAGGTIETQIRQLNAFSNQDSDRTLYELDVLIGSDHNLRSVTMYQITCDATLGAIHFLYDGASSIRYENARVGGQDFTSGHCGNITFIQNQSLNLKLDINYQDNKVNVYRNDILICPLLDLGSESATTCHNGVGLAYSDEGATADRNVSMYIDNVNISSSSVESNTSGVGQPCSTGVECASSFCNQFKVCALKLNNAGCSSNSECLSSVCNPQNKCTKPSFTQVLDAGKTEQFGDDVNTNNFIALFIMIASAIVFVIAGTKGGHILAGLISGFCIFLVEAIFFALSVCCNILSSCFMFV